MSSDYVTKEYCLDELIRATEHKIPIAPVFLSAIPIEDMPLGLERMQRADLHHDRDYGSAVDELVRFAESHSGRRAVVADALARYLYGLQASLLGADGVLSHVALAGESDERMRAEPLERRHWPTVYELLKEEVRHAGSAIQNPEQPVESSTAAKIENVVEATQRLERSVLLGEPGAGKTATLQRSARERYGVHREADPARRPFLGLAVCREW